MAGYIFEHNGIGLRALEPDDSALIYEAENDPLNAAYNNYVAPYSSRQILEYALSYSADPIADKQLRLIGVDLRNDSEVGIIDLFDIDMRALTASIGVYVFPHHRKKGWSVRLIETAIDYAQNLLRISRFAAKAAADNKASIRMLRRAGFNDAGLLPEWIYSPQARRNVDLLLMHRTSNVP